MEELKWFKKCYFILLIVLIGIQKSEFCHNPVASTDLGHHRWKPHSRNAKISGAVWSVEGSPYDSDLCHKPWGRIIRIRYPVAYSKNQVRRNGLIYSQRDLGQSKIQGHTASKLRAGHLNSGALNPSPNLFPHCHAAAAMRQDHESRAFTNPGPQKVSYLPSCLLIVYPKRGLLAKLMFTPTSGVPSDVITWPRMTHACLWVEKKHDILFTPRTLAGRDPLTLGRSEDRSSPFRQSWYPGSHGIHSRWTIIFFFFILPQFKASKYPLKNY